MSEIRFENAKYPDAETRREYIEKNFPRGEKRDAAIASMNWTLLQIDKFLQKQYSLRDAAVSALRRGNHVELREFLRRIGENEG